MYCVICYLYHNRAKNWHYFMCNSFRCRALVCISHGVTEHMGRYEQLAQLLADSGFCVFGHDHGKTKPSVVLDV